MSSFNTFQVIIIKSHLVNNDAAALTLASFKRSHLVGKGPQTFSTVFTRITGDFGLVAQNPLFENGLLFMILSSSAVPVCDLIKTRTIKLFERKHRCAYIGQS